MWPSISLPFWRRVGWQGVATVSSKLCTSGQGRPGQARAGQGRAERDTGGHLGERRLAEGTMSAFVGGGAHQPAPGVEEVGVRIHFRVQVRQLHGAERSGGEGGAARSEDDAGVVSGNVGEGKWQEGGRGAPGGKRRGGRPCGSGRCCRTPVSAPCPAAPCASRGCLWSGTGTGSRRGVSRGAAERGRQPRILLHMRK